jgi:hypothetical protein
MAAQRFPRRPRSGVWGPRPQGQPLQCRNDTGKERRLPLLSVTGIEHEGAHMTSDTRPRKTRENQGWLWDSTAWNGFPFRKDDIVVATYAKTGTTWM